ncbi:MAG: phage tail protein [Acidimicrobiales bacterium]
MAVPAADATGLGVVNRFKVVIDNAIDLGAWATCKGLTVKFEMEKVKVGGNYEHEVLLPKMVTYSAVTLARVMTLQDSATVQGWLSAQSSAHQNNELKGSTAEITVFDHHLEKVVSFSLRNVYPSSWKCPPLDANGKIVAVEELELVHEGFL